MADQTTTARRLLTQRKPFIPCNTRAKKNTIGREWPELRTGYSVVPWDEFNLLNLDESYGHVLDHEFQMALASGALPAETLTGFSVDKDKDINHLIGWHQSVIKPTLEFAKEHLELYPGLVLRYEHSSADNPSFVRMPDVRDPILVDHLVRIDDSSPNLVAGLGKTSLKWGGRRVLNQRDKPTTEYVLPLEQLANICKAGNTRYGYIQTEEELVACQFSTDDGKVWMAAIMPVPWSRHGPKVLTTGLALWWLGMLAMSHEDNRRIVAHGRTVAINEWEDDEAGLTCRHRYSNLVRPARPGPPGHDAPMDPHGNHPANAPPPVDLANAAFPLLDPAIAWPEPGFDFDFDFNPAQMPTPP